MDHHFQICDRVWIHIRKDRLQGEGRKLKPISYGPFTSLDKVDNNDLFDAFHVIICTCLGLIPTIPALLDELTRSVE